MAEIKDSFSYKWFTEVWNNGRREMIDELMLPGTTAHGNLEKEPPRGAEGFRLFYDGFTGQFKDIKVTVDDVISEGDTECARLSVQAEHLQSGVKVDFTGMCMIKLHEGKIAEAWNNFDFLTMYQQLGQKLV